jgi:hypothetical protein
VLQHGSKVEMKRSFNKYTSSDVSLVPLFDGRSVLRTYAHDDVSVGSWMIGLAVKHVNEAKLCCSSWPSGFSLSFAISIGLFIDSYFFPFDTWDVVLP